MGTLSGGQSFRWTYDKDTDVWTGIFSKTVWKLKQEDDYLLYQIIGSLINASTKENHYPSYVQGCNYNVRGLLSPFYHSEYQA